MKWIVAPALLAMLIGCSGGTPASPDTTPDAPQAPPKVAVAPATTEPTQVGLVKNGEAVHVGAETEDAIKLLKAGAQGGFSSERLPEGFSSPYQSHIWQAGESGFGILSFKGKVVMAMIQDANSTPEHLSELRTAQQALVGYTNEGKVSGQTMMIMAFQRTGGKLYIASAMGDDSVLTALGISEAQARIDQQDADKIIQKLEAEQNEKKNAAKR